MKKKYVLVALCFLVVVVIAITLLVKRDKKQTSIRTAGIVEGIEVNISTTVPGRILRECCKEGDTVTQGMTVVELESDHIKASLDQARAGLEKANAEVRVAGSAVDSAKANIRSAEADVANAEADIDRARAQMEEANREMGRLNTLFNQQIIPKASLDVAVTNYETAVANFKASKAQLGAAVSKKDAAAAQLKTAENQRTSAMASLKQSEANVSYSQAKLAETVIKSPVSGTVVFKALEQGETVSPGTTILTIVDLDNLYVRVDLEETMISSITLNSEAMIRAEGAPDRIFKGKISEIGEYAEFATQKDVTRGRQDIKTFKVKIALEETGGLLKPGMTVDVEIPLRDTK
jgi:HlyD family secretion protein